MMEEIDNLIKELWKLNAKPVLISLTMKDHFDLLKEASSPINLTVVKDITTFLGIPVYKTLEND